jgi:hypothetical protein
LGKKPESKDDTNNQTNNWMTSVTLQCKVSEDGPSKNSTHLKENTVALEECHLLGGSTV